MRIVFLFSGSLLLFRISGLDGTGNARGLSDLIEFSFSLPLLLFAFFSSLAQVPITSFHMCSACNVENIVDPGEGTKGNRF